MPSGRTEVSIANQALTRLGQERIMSFQDNNNRAVCMAENYYALRDSVTEERMWSFATVRAISETGARDEWDAAWVHSKPLDWLQVKRVFRTVDKDVVEDWSAEGISILVKDYKRVYLWGVKKVEDVGQWTEQASQVLAFRLAAEAAVPLTENVELQQTMWALYEQKLREAAATDAGQAKSEQFTSHNLLRAR